MLFVEDAAVATHSPSYVKYFMDYFASVCTDFGLTNSFKTLSLIFSLSSSTHIAINNSSGRQPYT